MSVVNIFLVIYAIHIFSLFIYLIVRIARGKNNIRFEMIAPAFLLPVAGVLIVTAIDHLSAKEKAGSRPLDMEKLDLGADTYWKPIKQSSENKNIVPLEEAITLNDHQVRRKLLLDTLFEDPKRYLDVLLVARENPDVEITHYATTTISKIRSDYQNKLKRLSSRVTDLTSVSDMLLNDLIKEMIDFIDSGLLEDNLLLVQRAKLNEYLTEKLARDPFNENAIYQKIENHLALGQYAEPKELIMDLLSMKPSNETVWHEAIQYCLQSNDPVFFEFIKTKMNEMVDKIYWTRGGYEKVSPWITVQSQHYLSHVITEDR